MSLLEGAGLFWRRNSTSLQGVKWTDMEVSSPRGSSGGLTTKRYEGKGGWLGEKETRGQMEGSFFFKGLAARKVQPTTKKNLCPSNWRGDWRLSALLIGAAKPKRGDGKGGQRFQGITCVRSGNGIPSFASSKGFSALHSQAADVAR